MRKAASGFDTGDIYGRLQTIYKVGGLDRRRGEGPSTGMGMGGRRSIRGDEVQSQLSHVTTTRIAWFQRMGDGCRPGSGPPEVSSMGPSPSTARPCAVTIAAHRYGNRARMGGGEGGGGGAPRAVHLAPGASSRRRFGWRAHSV